MLTEEQVIKLLADCMEKRLLAHIEHKPNVEDMWHQRCVALEVVLEIREEL